MLSNSWSLHIGYIVFFCICGFYSWLSAGNLFYIGQANMMPVFIIINWTQFFMLPALTMKSIADEKRNGTIELMLTKPVKISDLVCGKFLANLVITTLALFLTLPYYITLASLGQVDHGAIVLGYLGLIQMSACYISIGLFSSALSRTPVSAFFISFGIGLCFQLLFGILANQVGNGFGPTCSAICPWKNTLTPYPGGFWIPGTSYTLHQSSPSFVSDQISHL